MSKLVQLFAACALAAGLMTAVPDLALAQRHHHGGWHGGYHGGWRGGGWRGGGFSFGWGWGYPFAYYPPAYYYPPPYYTRDCGWVRVRVWRHGRWYWRRAWRCW